MKKPNLFTIFIFGVVLISITSVGYATEEMNEELIAEFKVDLTGDGKDEIVTVKGIRFEEGAQFLKSIFVGIEDSQGKQQSIELEGGYDPQLQFVDFDHDGIKDMFISVPTGGSGGLQNYYLYTLKNSELTDLTVPSPLSIQSEFLNGYKAKITIDEVKKSYKFNLKNRAEDYERLGIFMNGKLNEPTELIVSPFGRLEPVILKGNRMGLKGYQRISGAYRADGIADVVSTWQYDNWEWKLSRVEVTDLKGKKKRKK